MSGVGFSDLGCGRISRRGKRGRGGIGAEHQRLMSLTAHRWCDGGHLRRVRDYRGQTTAASEASSTEEIALAFGRDVFAYVCDPAVPWRPERDGGWLQRAMPRRWAPAIAT